MSQIAAVSTPKPRVATRRRFGIATATRTSRVALVLALLLIMGLAVLPLWADRGIVQDLFSILTLLTLAQFWNLLAGYAGLVSIGQQAFVGLGAYMLFSLTIMAGLDPTLSILLAGVIAGAVALPCALLVFRLRNAYFAVGTWVLAEVFRLLFAQVRGLGGGTGMSLPKSVTSESPLVGLVVGLTGARVPAARDIAAYWLALVLAVAAMGIVYALLRSRRGLALAAMADSEAAAGSVGVDPLRVKLLVYAVSAFGAGLTGALIYLQKARISPDAAFSVTDWTAFVFFVVIIGGIATLEGPVVGVLIFWVLQHELSSYGTLYLMLLGSLAILVMLVFPKGLWGSFADRFDIHLFPIRRRLVALNDHQGSWRQGGAPDPPVPGKALDQKAASLWKP